MRNPDRYTWFGIEKPFPWALLAWPVLWLWSTVREWRKPPVRSIGTSVYTGIAEDIDMPIIRTGKMNIEDVPDGPPIPMSEFYLGRRYGPNGWVDQDADLPQAGSAWNWKIKIGDTDYE